MKTKSKKKYDPLLRDGLYVSYLLKTKGIKQTDIARDLGIRKQTVNGVLHGRENSKRILDHIASLGIPKIHLGASR